MMVLVDFGGCSCGCTPHEAKEVTSETRDGLIWGLAVVANEYRTRGDKPYAKISFEELPPDITRDEVLALAARLADFDDRMHEKERKIDNTFLLPFMCREGYQLTPEQNEVNRKAKEDQEARNRAVEAEVAKILEEKLSLKRGDYEECYHHDDFEEDD